MLIFHLCHAQSRYRSINWTICTTKFVVLRHKQVCICLQKHSLLGSGSTVAVSCGLVSELSICCFLVYLCSLSVDRVLNCRSQLFRGQTCSTGTLFSVRWHQQPIVQQSLAAETALWYTLFLDFQLWTHFVCINAYHLIGSSFCSHQDFSSSAHLFILPCQRY